MNILKHELKLYRNTTIIWTVSLALVMVFFSSIFPSFQGSAEAMNKILEAFPDALKQALGLSTMDLSSALGFLGFMFAYVVLVGAIQAMNLGLSILSNEQRDKTADFLLAKPVKRISIVHAKFTAGLINIVATNIVFTIVTFISISAIEKDYSPKILMLFIGSLFLIQLFFLTFGMLLSVFMNKLKTVIPVSLGVVFGFFILNLLNESLSGKPLTAISPFAYFSTTGIYENSAYDTKWLILNCVLVVVFTVGAYVKYIKKDIPSV